jgi:hypothetical protein
MARKSKRKRKRMPYLDASAEDILSIGDLSQDRAPSLRREQQRKRKKRNK